MKAICIDSTGHNGITVGKVYEVNAKTSDATFTLNNDEGFPVSLLRYRFKLVPETDYQALKDALTVLENHGYNQFSYSGINCWHTAADVLGKVFPNVVRKQELEKIIKEAQEELETL